jgi:hypothetical protein
MKAFISEFSGRGDKRRSTFLRTQRFRCVFSAFIVLCFFSTCAWAVELQGETISAWNQYIQWADQKVQRELTAPDKFLIEDNFAPRDKASMQRQLENGQIVVEQMNGVVPRGAAFSVPDGEIHHWWGAILIPNVELPDLLRFLQDYDHHAGRFADVEKSRLLSRHDGQFRFYFRLKRSKAFVTAYYNTEQECVYTRWDAKHVSSRSNATKIAELENPGTQAEQERPQGNNRGFLWRLVSWWRFQQTESGVIVELESASLSRNIPTFVKLLPGVSSYIRSTPMESLESVLTSIRDYARTALAHSGPR